MEKQQADSTLDLTPFYNWRKFSCLSVILLTLICPSMKAQDSIDIWNLPPLSIEQGRYTTDWNNLSRQYNTPAWWREAKLGAWSHWDPQSMAEDGDW